MPNNRRRASSEPSTKGERTRQRIVADTAAVFNTRGFEGSSLAALMAATGLQKGGIYRHFGSKEELAAEAFEYAWAMARAAREPDLDRRADPIGWLKAYIDNLVSRRPPVAGGCPLLNTAIEADDGNALLRARVAKALRAWISRLEEVVGYGLKSGRICAGTDPHALATVIVATVEGAVMISRIEKNSEALRHAQIHLHRYLESVTC
jgi:TetR/AcrR family transcriptional regulator, transcriptional repressor for nem operon